jgi:hypothetical protein
MGSIFIIIIAMPLVLILVVALIKLCPKKCGRNVNWWYVYVTPKLRTNLKDFFFNGILEFLEHSYLVLLLMAMINIIDLRIGLSYNFVENLNSLLSVTWLIFSLLWPFAIVALYVKKIERAEPFPDLKDTMTLSQIKSIYGHTDIADIQKNAYTESKHNKLMKSYGVLLSDLDLERSGKCLVLTAVLIKFVRKALFVIGIIVFIKLPSFTIFNFNFNILFYIMFTTYFNLYKEKTLLFRRTLDELTMLLVNYCLFTLTDFATIEQSLIMGDVVI